MKSANVKTEISFVMDLLSQLRDGRLRVPKFQRPFVWSHERVRRLLDSIRKGYPIGSIFVWETSGRYDNNDHIGPVIVAVDKPAQPTPVGYLLDGHQRLSTLMGTLVSSTEVLNLSKNAIFRVYYNLKTNEFEHIRHPKVEHFALNQLMDTSDFIDACSQLLKKAPSKEIGADWIKTAKELVEIFQHCAVGLTKVFHHEMAEAIEAFTRLNTEGCRMSPEQIFFALTHDEKGFNLGTSVDQLTEDILTPKNYGEISRTALLRVILAALERDIYSSAMDWRKLVEEEKDNLENTFEQCRNSLHAAIHFLHERIGASSQKTLPYALQLVLLSEFFKCTSPREPSEESLGYIERWFWVSAFSGAYTVGSTSRFNEAVVFARSLARGQAVALDLNSPALKLPRQFHQKSARVRALFLFLKSLEPLDPSTGTPIQYVLDAGFQDALLLYRDTKEQRGDTANRVLLGAHFSNSPLDAFRSLKSQDTEFRARVLRSHAISEAAFEALQADDAEQFIEERAKSMKEAELEFMKKKNVTIPLDSGQNDENLLTDDSDD